MKKILTIFVAAAMLLGLASCSGDLHNDMDPAKVAMLQGEKKTFLDTADICGTVNGWTGAALNKVDETTYTYEFVADPTINDTNDGKLFKFSIREVAGSWTDGNRWCGDYDAEGGDAVHGVKVGEENTMVWSDKPNPSHFELRDTVPNTTYIITIKITDEDKKNLSVSFKADGDAPVADTPAPYYFDGLYLVGGCFNTSANSSGANTWDFYTSNLIHGASKDVTTGNVTYTVDIKATAASGEMGINDSSWGNKLNGVGVTIAANATTATELNGTEGNFNVTGLTVGSAYRVEITTTPAKVVTVKIYEIAEITLSVKITNLTEGDSAWINGNIWGSSWPMGWPIVEWNNNDATKTAGYISAHAAAVADDTGNAVFGSAWNTTVIAKPGDTLNWEFKVVYINNGDAWDDKGAVKDCGDNITFDYDVTTGGAKTLVIDASDWSVTVE